MKMIVFVALALVAVAAAVPLDPIPIVRSSSVSQPNGNYEFSFETGNGIQRQETGEVKEVQDEDKKLHSVVVVRGSYVYLGDDGKPVSITFRADENGYEAVGESIPKVTARR